MSDRVFFLVAALVAGLMVYLAMTLGVNQLPNGPIGGGESNYRNIIVEGDQLARIESGGEAVDLRRIGEGDDMTVEVYADFGALSDDPTRGPHFKLDADLEAAFAGRTLEVTITARPTDTRGAQMMFVNYSTGKGGDSGWLGFDLATEYSDYRFTYDVPKEVPVRGYDYLAIKPDVPAKSRGLEIRKIELKLLGRWG